MGADLLRCAWYKDLQRRLTMLVAQEGSSSDCVLNSHPPGVELGLLTIRNWQ